MESIAGPGPLPRNRAMTSLVDLEGESRSYIDDFDKVLGCATLWIAKGQTILGIFEKIRSILSSPGNSNFAEQLGTFPHTCTFSWMFEPFQKLLEFADSLARSSLSFCKAIDEFAIPMINQQLSSDQAAVATWQAKVEAAWRAERICVASIRSSALRIETSCSRMSSKRKASFKLLKKYVRDVKDQRAMIAEVNARHKVLVEAALAGIDFLKDVLIASESKMKALLAVALPTFIAVIEDSKRARKGLIGRQGNWVVDFQAFVGQNGIVRSAIPREEFPLFRFPFEHPLLMERWMPDTVRNRVIPTAIGVASAAFEGQADSELSVKKGDRLFLYEMWRSNFWLFAQTVDEKAWGFIPSNVIDVMKGKTMFAKGAQFPTREGESSCRSGELVIFRSESDGFIVCESADGTEKVIRAGILFET
jgi:hypothetical protein